jgi:deazaflavin-dependent oxidoreductase (nitroreductase family)
MTFPRALARYTRGAVNTMTLHLAGHAAFADLEHTGRKSGTVRHTPVRAFRAGDTVVVGLNFGRQSDWYQNIKAAGTCRMRLDGGLLTLGTPELIPAAEGAEGMPWLFRFALRDVIRTADCVRLPILDSSRVPAIRHRPAHNRAGAPADICHTRSATSARRPLMIARKSPTAPERRCAPRSRQGR